MPAIPVPKTRGELETQISRAVIQFEKEFMGRGPLETKTYLLDDLIVVRLKGVLTPAERKLSESQTDRSAYLLKQVRNELLASGRPLLEALIRDLVGVEIQSVHTDISTKTGERILVITLQQKPEFARGEGELTVARDGRASDINGNSTPVSPEAGSRRDGLRRQALRVAGEQ